MNCTEIRSLIDGVIFGVITSSAVDCGFEPQSAQTKDYKIGICCFSTKHTALWSKNKDWWTWNHNNVSKWSDISMQELLFQWAGTIKPQLTMLV